MKHVNTVFTRALEVRIKMMVTHHEMKHKVIVTFSIYSKWMYLIDSTDYKIQYRFFIENN